MTTKEYVEYLLKHRRMFERDLEQMALQMAHLKHKAENAEKGGVRELPFRRMGNPIYGEVYRRVGSACYDEIKEMHDALALELQRLEAAADALEARDKAVLKCIYEHRLTWKQTGAKLFLSRNTVARSRSRALRFIVSCFDATSGMATAEVKPAAIPS